MEAEARFYPGPKQMPKVLDYKDLRAQLILAVQGKVIAQMKVQKLSRRALAKKAGITFAMVKSVIDGDYDPKLSTIGRLARGLGIPITELMP